MDFDANNHVSYVAVVIVVVVVVVVFKVPSPGPSTKMQGVTASFDYLIVIIKASIHSKTMQDRLICDLGYEKKLFLMSYRFAETN